VLIKKMPDRHRSPGKDLSDHLIDRFGGRRLGCLNPGWEYIGHIQDREIKVCFECDIDEIEKAVKKELEAQ